MRVSSISIQNGKNTTQFDLDADKVSDPNGIVLEVLTGLFNSQNIIKGIDGYSAVIEFNSDQGFSILSIIRVIKENIFDVRINGQPTDKDVFTLISELLGRTFNQEVWSSFIKLLPGRIHSDNDIKRLFTQNAINDFPESAEALENEAPRKVIEQKIAKLEHEIDHYKSQRTERQRHEEVIKTNTKRIDVISEKLSSSKHLIAIINKIDEELKRFGAMTYTNDINQQILQIRRNRISTVLNLLRSIRSKAHFLVKEHPGAKKNAGSETKYFVGLVTFLGVITTILHLSTNSLLVMLLGGLGFLFIFIVMMYLKVTLTSDLNTKTAVPKVRSGERKAITYQQLTRNFNKREDELLVNSAWVNALKQERLRILQSISKRLGNQTYDTLLKSESELRKGIDASREEIIQIMAEKISAESYLRKRRELDLLKIDLAEAVEDSELLLEDLLEKIAIPFVLVQSKESSLNEDAEIYLDMVKSRIQIIQL